MIKAKQTIILITSYLITNNKGIIAQIKSSDIWANNSIIILF